MAQPPSLARRLDTGDAVAIGLGSMLGAGVFAAFTPAAAVAGSGLLVGLVLAALVAYCNATSSAQLAAQYPRSGGTYVYGRERLGPWWGFLAGWSFVVGKTASCAAMALTFARYAAPEGWERPLAVTAVVALVGLNCLGITRTARATRAVVAVSLPALGIVMGAAASGGQARLARVALPDWSTAPWLGILQSAGLLFFAFAGYARVATLGEEVRDPSRTIPRAILWALSIAAAIYIGVAVSILAVLGADGVAGTSAPLAATVAAGSWAPVTPMVRLGAAAASLGALLALVAGIGRTAFAMARGGDLPGWLSAVHPRFRVPHRAEMAVGAVVVVLVLTLDLGGAIGFSSFGVLLYYLVANLAALTQPAEHRRYARAVQLLGAAGCTVLAACLPAAAVLTGIAVLGFGVAYRTWRLRGKP